MPGVSRLLGYFPDWSLFWLFLSLGSNQKTYRSIEIDYRQTLLLEEIHFPLQIQNRAARRINFHYRDRSVGMSAENLSFQIQILF